MKKALIVLAAGTVVAAAGAAYGWRRYRIRKEIEASLPPVDIAGPVALTAQEFLDFDEIAEKSCFEPCCIDEDEIDMHFLRSIIEDED